jgi:imidazolonepropionase-like amidohydrolase
MIAVVTSSNTIITKREVLLLGIALLQALHRCHLRLVICCVLCTFILQHTAYALEQPITPATTASAFVGAKVMQSSVMQNHTSFQAATVLVKAGKIVQLLPAGRPIPANYQIIDVSGQYLVPGLMDAHIHLAQSGSAFTRPDMIEATAIQPYNTDQQWLQDQLPALLNTYFSLGITTVADMGGPAARLGRYQRLSQQPGFPEILAAAELLSPASVPQLTTADGKTFLEVRSATDAKKAALQQIAQGAAILKIVWSQETGLSDAQLTTLYQDAILTAKAAGKVVAVHVESLASAKAAIRAGVDILVHGVVSEPIDDEFITLARHHQVSYLPTMTAYQHYADIFNGDLSFTEFEHQLSHHPLIQSFEKLNANTDKTGEMYQLFHRYMPYVDAPAAKLASLSKDEQSIVSQLAAVFSVKLADIQRQNLQRALQSGLNLAFGTDAGNPGTLHATSIREEMRAWRQAGASQADILRAMTYGNALALKLEHRQGSISPGQQATFILLQDNPVAKDYQLTKPAMVVQHGIILAQ